MVYCGISCGVVDGRDFTMMEIVFVLGLLALLCVVLPPPA